MARRRRRGNFNPHGLNPKDDDIFIAERADECASCASQFEPDQLVVGKPWGVMSWRYYCSRACAADNYASKGQQFARRVLDRSRGLKGLDSAASRTPAWPPSNEDVPAWMTAGAHGDAEAMFNAFWRGSHNNGFDWHLGRFLPTHFPDLSRGCLVILQPMSREWSQGYDHHGVVNLDWIMSLQGHDGAGTRAMEWLCALADEHEVVLILTAGAGPHARVKTLPTRTLQKFYKRFGFTQRGRDPKAMHRLPAGRG